VAEIFGPGFGLMVLGLLFLFGLAFDFSGGLGDDGGSSL